MSLDKSVHLCLECFSLHSLASVVANDGKCLECNADQPGLPSLEESDSGEVNSEAFNKVVTEKSHKDDKLTLLGKVDVKKHEDKDEFEAKVEAELKKELEVLGYGEEFEKSVEAKKNKASKEKGAVKAASVTDSPEKMTSKSVEESKIEEEIQQKEKLGTEAVLDVKEEGANLELPSSKDGKIEEVSTKEPQTDKKLVSWLISTAKGGGEKVNETPENIAKNEVELVEIAENTVKDEVEVVETAVVNPPEEQPSSKNEEPSDKELKEEGVISKPKENIDVSFSSSFDDFVGIPTVRKVGASQ